MPSVALAKAGIPWTKYPQHLISRFLSIFPLRTSEVKSLSSRASRASVQTLDSHPGRIAHVSPLTIRVIPCLKRGDRFVKLLTRILPGFTWRWGLKSAYDIEQRSFWRHLWPILRDEGFDILHVQDPLLADLCRRYRKAGKLKTKEILAHGTEEPVEFLEKFEYVQHLAPWHLEQALKKIEEKRGLHH
jgi:hypothetical protein